MCYTGSAVDFDAWKTDGWDSKSLIALANKAENHQLEDQAIDMSAHGQGGLIEVTHGTHALTNNYDDLFDAAKTLGVPKVSNLQDFTVGHGFERWAKYISKDGKRQDTAHSYIHPLMKSGNYPNLHILPNSTVTRVRFDGTRAIGVEYVPTEGAGDAEPAFISANKQVVVAAGTLKTPLVLERSGVGSAELLRGLDINVVSDLPSVGEELQDHNLITYRYKSNITPEMSFDGLMSGREDFAKALAEGSSKMAWNGLDLGGKLRPTEEEVAALGSEFKEHWDRDFKDSPSRPIMLMALFPGYFGDHVALNEPADNPKHYMTTGMYTAYPYSRGSTHITSKDAKAPPSLITGYLTKNVDLTKQVWAYKLQREMMRRSDKYAGEEPASHPVFAEGSNAASRDGPAVEGGFKSLEDRAKLPKIEYSEADDKVIEDWIRTHIASAWHTLGTCKMAPKDKGGVVDKDLNVYGTQGLKVAGKPSYADSRCDLSVTNPEPDLSIVPENVGANTYNTAIIVGEKAAQIIGAELGLVI